MALRNILNDGDPTLLKKSRPVVEFNDRLHVLLDDMRETIIDAEGAGLAAPQVGVLRRAVLIVDFSQLDGELNEHIIEMINPEIINIEGEQIGFEGCLSIPGMMGLVKRPMKVRVKALDRYGKEFELEREEMTARAICHEVDHLDGILYTSLTDEFYSNDEIEEMMQEA